MSTAMAATLEMDKGEGITLTLEDTTNQVTSKIVFDGKKITIEIKNSSDTATIELKPEAIKIAAKTITLEGEKINLNATDTIALKADKNITGQATQKLDLKADQEGSIKGAQKLALSSAQITATGDTSVEAKSGPASLKLATAGDATLKGVNLALEGSAQAKMKGAQVGVEATAQLELKSALAAALKGTQVEVKGVMNMIG